MAENLILTKEGLRKYWPISKNINDDRLNPYILRAQQSQLKPFLGEVFYSDLLTNIMQPDYQRLFYGGQFDYNGELVWFSGVEALLSAFAYGLFLHDNPLHVSRAGNKNKTDENSVEIDTQQTRIKANEAKSEAVRIQQEVSRYLDNSKGLFPKWGVGTSLNTPVKTGFSFLKVPRSIQR